MTAKAKTRAPSGTYTVSQVALLLGVSPSHIANLIKQGTFPAKTIQLGKTTRVARSEMQAMLPYEDLDRLLKEVSADDESEELGNNR